MVDDGTSNLDRATMMERYPHFEYILKRPRDKGHASSMNALVYEFLLYSEDRRSTRTELLDKKEIYFMYLEDDWKLLNIPILHQRLATALESMKIHVPFYDDNHSFQTNHIFRDVLLTSTILLHHSISDDDKIHQVLFNEQASRVCAIADDACDFNVIGMGGWNKVKNISIFSDDDIIYLSIPYQLHEFGLVSSAAHQGGRIHDFSNWPGLSLNPGIWNLSEIYRVIQNCKIYHDYNKDDNSNGDELIFDENDILFEQRFSVTAYVCGLNMVYFPSLIFGHTGDVSAYNLNNISRPWD